VNIEFPSEKINGKLTAERFEAGGVAVTEAPVPATRSAPNIPVPAEDSGFYEITLDELANRVRDGRRKIENLECNALHAASELQRLALPIAIDMGNAINEAQGRLTSSDYKVWFDATCRSARVAPRTAKLFQQLARSGDVIDAEIMRTGEMLSIRAARRLISKSTKVDEDGADEDSSGAGGAENTGTPETEDAGEAAESELSSLDLLLTATPAPEVAVEFAKRDVPWLLERLPKPWIPTLTARVAKLPHVHDEPFIKASEVLRNALSAVAIADAPKTTSAVALSQERVALNALRRLNVLLDGAGIDEVTIIRMHAKEKRCVEGKRHRGKRRRAA
jgi:hypothetical protein